MHHIIRIECKDTNKGIYRSKLMRDVYSLTYYEQDFIDDFGELMWAVSEDDTDHRTPPPFECIIHDRLMPKSRFRRYHRFGFADWEQLTNWFTPTELYIIDQLGKAEVVVYEVKHLVAKNKQQLVYDHRKAKRIAHASVSLVYDKTEVDYNLIIESLKHLIRIGCDEDYHRFLELLDYEQLY